MMMMMQLKILNLNRGQCFVEKKNERNEIVSKRRKRWPKIYRIIIFQDCFDFFLLILSQKLLHQLTIATKVLDKKKNV